jgi:small subunit ribosomal protein S9
MTDEAIKTIKKKKKRRTGINVKARKKRAIARAVVFSGTGVVRINKRRLETLQPLLLRRFVNEPVQLAGDAIKVFNIDIQVHGGGFMGQAVAARTAIAKALVRATRDKNLTERFLKYDRLLLVDDPRQKEAKKPLGTGARKSKQKSKR